MNGYLQSLTLLTVAIPTGGVLLAVFFLYVTDLKPSGSCSTAGPEGEIPAVVTSLYDNSAKVIPAGIETADKAKLLTASLN
jgi:hypothetical protein